MKLYDGDKCPKCNDGSMEFVEMKDEEMIVCDNCEYAYYGE